MYKKQENDKWLIGKGVTFEIDIESKEMLLTCKVEYYEDEEGTILTKDAINDSSSTPDEKARLRNKYRDFAVTKTTRGFFKRTSNGEYVPVYPNTNIVATHKNTETGEFLWDYEGDDTDVITLDDVVTEREWWQVTFSGLATPLYALIDGHVDQVLQNNLV
jgi:hypothetical protein